MIIKQLFFGILSTLFAAEAFARGGVYDPTKAVLKESPYQACKGYKFLSKKDYDKKPSYWDKYCQQSSDKIQVLPETSSFVFKLQNATSSLALLSSVGEKVIKKLNANIEAQEKLLECFSRKKTGAECEKLTNAEIDKVYKLFTEMRQELALSEGEDVKLTGIRRGFGGKIEYPPLEELINPSLKKNFLGLAGVYRPEGLDPLTSIEAGVVQSLMQKKIDEVKTNPNLKSDKDRVAFFQQVRATHKARYLEIFQEAPLLTMVGRLPLRSDKEEIYTKFSKALQELLKFAKLERGQILSKWSRASMTPEIPGSRAFRAKGDENRASEILSFISYKPIVDEVLAEQIKTNPLACAMAEELGSTMESADLRGDIAITGAVVGGAIALTALTGGSAALVLPEMIPVVGGMAMSAQAAVAVALGPGIGFYTRKISEKDMDASKALVATGLKKAEELDIADGNLVAGNATIGLDYLGIGLFKTAGQALFNTVAKKALMSEGLNSAEAEKLILLSQSTAKQSSKEAELARERIKNSIRQKVQSVFQGREPNKEEMEALVALDELGGKQTESIKDFFLRMERIADKKEKKEVLVQAIQLIKLQNKELFQNASPDTLKELNRQVIAIARYGEVKDPAKIAAILSSWDLTAKSKLSQVYEEAYALLKDSKFMSGKSLKERRENAFKAVLEKKKVTDEKKRQDMCACSGVCGGGSVVFNSELDKLSLDKNNFCVSNETMTWLSRNM